MRSSLLSAVQQPVHAVALTADAQITALAKKLVPCERARARRTYHARTGTPTHLRKHVGHLQDPLVIELRNSLDASHLYVRRGMFDS